MQLSLLNVRSTCSYDVNNNQAVRFPIVIDVQILYKPHEMAEHGFTYLSVGRRQFIRRSKESLAS
jgi:hypothetical protein